MNHEESFRVESSLVPHPQPVVLGQSGTVIYLLKQDNETGRSGIRDVV